MLNIPSLTIAPGESFGLVGNNGAGKTTLFRCLLDLIQPTTGDVSIGGHRVDQSFEWKKFTGSYLDENYLIDYLTPDEYFQFVGSLNGLSKGDLETKLSVFAPVFNDEIVGKKKLIRDLSKGNQKKVGIAAALLSEPSVLVLDEPFANLDPSTQIRLKELLRKQKNEHGCTMLISSHDLNHVTEVCERIVLLEQGEVKQDIRTTSATLQALEDYFAVV